MALIKPAVPTTPNPLSQASINYITMTRALENQQIKFFDSIEELDNKQ
jgi:hypothetical protein